MEAATAQRVERNALDKKLAQRIEGLWKLGRPKGVLFFDDFTVVEVGGGGWKADTLYRFASRYVLICRESAEIKRFLDRGQQHKNVICEASVLKENSFSIEDLTDNKADLIVCLDPSAVASTKDDFIAVLHSMYVTCQPNALGIFQANYGKNKHSPYASDRDQNNVDLIFRIEEFWEVLEKAGFDPLCLREINRKTKEALFLVRRRS